MADIWFFHRANIQGHRTLQVRQFMETSRMVVYCWTVTYSPDTAHCVATASTSVQYSLYNQYNNTQLLKLSSVCNCTAICAVLSFDELYRKKSWVLVTSYQSTSISTQMLAGVANRQLYDPCYHSILVFLPLDIDARLTC